MPALVVVEEVVVEEEEEAVAAVFLHVLEATVNHAVQDPGLSRARTHTHSDMKPVWLVD